MILKLYRPTTPVDMRASISGLQEFPLLIYHMLILVLNSFGGVDSNYMRNHSFSLIPLFFHDGEEWTEFPPPSFADTSKTVPEQRH